MKIVDVLNNKKVLIWGYGREGKSTEKYIKENCAVQELRIFEGKENELPYDRYDVVIKSPGIIVEKYRENFTSQTELFLREFGGQTIGITGTKGKSTTTTMMRDVLAAASGKKVLLVGNIGVACFDCIPEIDADTVIAFEMSAHQLSHIKYSPHVGVFLNLYEEHLDYYGTMDKYFAAKSNVTLNQQAGDYFYCGDNVPEIATRAKMTRIDFAKTEAFPMKLRGKHNQFNANFVYKICTEVYGCTPEKVKAAIADFEGLEHRLEYVGCYDGVDYYNDSISTIPEAAIQAAESVPNTKTLLLGGLDRGIHYDVLIDFIKAHPEYQYVLSYAAGQRIFDSVKDLPNCHYEELLFNAFKLAKSLTPTGGACLLTPAAASYGYFKNFEDRGSYFKSLVRGENVDVR